MASRPGKSLGLESYKGPEIYPHSLTLKRIVSPPDATRSHDARLPLAGTILSLLIVSVPSPFTTLFPHSSPSSGRYPSLASASQMSHTLTATDIITLQSLLKSASTSPMNVASTFSGLTLQIERCKKGFGQACNYFLAEDKVDSIVGDYPDPETVEAHIQAGQSSTADIF